MVLLRQKLLYSCMVWLLLCPAIGQLYGQGNTAARYEIEAKRIGVDPHGNDALPRSREFIRLDSTYYVGYLLEGLYKAEHSSDRQGFILSVKPLEKALDLLTYDYGAALQNLYRDRNYFNQYVRVYQDFLTLCNVLTQCYDNTDQPGKTMAICNRMEDFDFPKDYFGIYSRRAWTYHRYRIFTSYDYSFLKQNIADNEALALQQCYDGLDNIEWNKPRNDAMFGSSQAMNDQLTIYHYLAFLQSYNKHYDSSEYYYSILAKHGAISWNNYGGLQHELGHFRMAQEYFSKDLYARFDHSLKEPAYFIPMLQVYANKPLEGIRLVEQIIQDNGSTPGFGWYNIALARSFMYNAQLDSCEWALDKAANFKEVHIGTTLTQEQYNFSIQLLKVQLLDRKIALEKFMHRRWYFSLTEIGKIGKLKFQKFIAEYIVNNMLANNPDRERLFYDLFCSESTTTFDEAWYLMKDFGSRFLEKKYGDYQNNDKRKEIIRYFQLMEAKLDWENGHYSKAKINMYKLLEGKTVDGDFEKLFLGRLYELAAMIGHEADNADEAAYYDQQLLATYPQLIPFSGLQIDCRLAVSGVEDATTKEVISQLKKTKISWTERNNTPTVQLFFSQSSAKDYHLEGRLISAKGELLKATKSINFSQSGDVLQLLIMQLFSK